MKWLIGIGILAALATVAFLFFWDVPDEATTKDHRKRKSQNENSGITAIILTVLKSNCGRIEFLFSIESIKHDLSS